MSLKNFIKSILGIKKLDVEVDKYYLKLHHTTEDKVEYEVEYEPTTEEVIIKIKSKNRTDRIDINHTVFVQAWSEYLSDISNKAVGIHTQTGEDSWGENYTLLIEKSNEGEIKLHYTTHFGKDDYSEDFTIRNSDTKFVLEMLKSAYERAVEYKADFEAEE